MPSFINEILLAEVKSLVEDSGALVIFDPSGLRADESLALRRQLYAAGAMMKVAKANLVRHAVSEELAAQLKVPGSLALVTGEDIAGAAKILRDLVKEERIELRGGSIEGRVLDSTETLKLADLPSREQLYGMFVNVLAAPITGLARVIQEVPTSLVRVLQAVKEKQS